MKKKTILFLYNNDKALKLYDALVEKGEDIILYSEKIDLDYIKKVNPYFIISYSYRYIISEDIIVYMENRIVNLHISVLPWNRGANPNFWSFIDNTPKGVTIHLLEKELDKGRILLQKEIIFDETKETFSSTYDKLNAEIIDLFLKNWTEIKSSRIEPKKQKGIGSYHSVKDFDEFLDGEKLDWNIIIATYKEKQRIVISMADF